MEVKYGNLYFAFINMGKEKRKAARLNGKSAAQAFTEATAALQMFYL
ncbi:hypothetical protein [Bacteroides acidifaciens]|nr:hypothetical protein [Bacteroides acidifaciens]